ncbi:MAG TPA: ABC transporter permease [Lacunisphaera sp.]
MHDLRFALRQLVKAPGFTAVAVLTLALGIGLNTSVFSLMNLLILQPLPYADKDHLVRIHRTTQQSAVATHAAADYLDLARDSRDIADIAVHRWAGLSIAPNDRPPFTLNALRVSVNFFSILGMQPELGRTFVVDEDRSGHQVLILSHEIWQKQFGGDPSIIGRTVRVDGQSTTIIGVMPEAFTSVFVWGPGEAFVPLNLTDAEKRERNDSSLQIVARYRPDISLEQLNARLAIFAQHLAALRPPEHRHDGLQAVTLQSTASNPVTRGVSWLLVGLAGSVLLIACANLANLQLARAIARMHEIAIRSALGASRVRLLRPLVAESLLLSLTGGSLGVLAATWANDWISSRLSSHGIVALALVIDWRVLAFTLALSAVTGLAFGLVPAWLMSRLRIDDTLKSGGHGHTGDRAQHRLSHSLIIVQFALSLVLLSAGGLFLRGLDRMLSRDLGWDRHSMLQGTLNLPPAKYSDVTQTYAFYTRLQERLAALPGVENVAIAWTLPIFQFVNQRNCIVEGHSPPLRGTEPLVYVNGVTPSFLATLKIRLIAGRNFTEADKLTSQPVTIINETMAHALFPGENPVGQHIADPNMPQRIWAEIVGVIPDQRFPIAAVTSVTRFQVLRPLAQETWNQVNVSLRASAADTLAEPMRRAIAEIDPDLAVRELSTVDQLIETSATFLSLMDHLLITFAALGLFLSSLGLYGVILHMVTLRSREIGVRVALGAQPRDVIWLIVRSGLRLTLTGAARGLVVTIGLVRLVTTLTPELPLRDPLAIATVTLLLLAVALLSCWLPARRATKVDPLVALRSE